MFTNPSELGRIHQNEVLVSTARLRSLASMSGALFVPFAGTFALGSSIGDTVTEFSAGFGRIIGHRHTIGASFSVVDRIPGGFRMGLGSALHFPSGTENSGLHIGAAVTRLPKLPVFAGGAAYWAVPEILRLQVAGRSRTKRALYLGADLLVTSNVALQLGTQSFKNISGGITIATPLLTIELGGGKSGVALSLNFVVSRASSASRLDSYTSGLQAFAEGRYAEAREFFLLAVEHDEYDEESRGLAEESQRLVDSSVVALLAQAKSHEGRKNFLAAMRTYAQIFRIAPERAETATGLKDMELKLGLYVQNLISTGDSLRQRKENARARRSYELALELDPSNEVAAARLDELENLSRENVKAILSRARVLLSRDQLDEAQAEYERALLIEPKNSQARAGLSTIRSRRTKAAFDQAKLLFGEGKYSEALPLLADVVQKDERNSEARQYLERTRRILEPEVENIFKIGLQFYVREEYREAIEAWDKGLLIQPHHAATREYRKRAEEKLKALEKLK
jgi:tetratricopeptide (TPR) repeat protein